MLVTGELKIAEIIKVYLRTFRYLLHACLLIAHLDTSGRKSTTTKPLFLFYSFMKITDLLI